MAALRESATGRGFALVVGLLVHRVDSHLNWSKKRRKKGPAGVHMPAQVKACALPKKLVRTPPNLPDTTV
jgi:hypothetical protein